MPLFTKKPLKNASSPTPFDNNNFKSSTTNINSLLTSPILPPISPTLAAPTIQTQTAAIINKTVPKPQIDANILKPQLVFHCQLAHGSPTGLISGFASVKELYQKIAECYDFPVDEVRFPTIFLQHSFFIFDRKSNAALNY